MTVTDTDLGHNLLTVFAKIGVQLGDIHSEMKKQNQLDKAARRASTPVWSKRPFAFTCNSSGLGMTEAGGVTQGFIRHIRKVIIAAPDPNTLVSGAIFTYITSASISPAGSLDPLRNTTAILGAGDLQDYSPSSVGIPNKAFYSEGEMTLRHSERLLIVVTGAPANQNLIAAVSFQEFQEATLSQVFTV